MERRRKRKRESDSAAERGFVFKTKQRVYNLPAAAAWYCENTAVPPAAANHPLTLLGWTMTSGNFWFRLRAKGIISTGDTGSVPPPPSHPPHSLLFFLSWHQSPDDRTSELIKMLTHSRLQWLQKAKKKKEQVQWGAASGAESTDGPCLWVLPLRHHTGWPDCWRVLGQYAAWNYSGQTKCCVKVNQSLCLNLILS